MEEKRIVENPYRINEMHEQELKSFLDSKVRQYQNAAFIQDDPVWIPHQYIKLQDIELSGFFAALFAWGRRSLILKKTETLLALMDHAPYQFVTEHEEKDLKRFTGFVHRTFNLTDILYFIDFFRGYYSRHDSLENAFCQFVSAGDKTVEKGLTGFHQLIFAGVHPHRTRKHISSPEGKSACKRMNMFLRWMVRTDQEGVDFGLWKKIKPAQLVIPMDVHVSRVAARLGLIAPDPVNWKTAVALTEALRIFDPKDPVKYDFALFGLGVIEKFS